jgi:hypothetical protein
MKSLASLYKRIGIAAVVLGLSGCAATQSAAKHEGPHSSNSPTAMGGMQGGMMHEDKMGKMDMKSMCEMHAQMMKKSPEERQKMMEAHGCNMSPEMMKKHMDMMHEKCS